MIGEHAVKDNRAGGGCVKDQPSRNTLLFSVSYSPVKDNKINYQVQYNGYVHIDNPDAGNCSAWKPDKNRKPQIILPPFTPDAERSEGTKQLGRILAVKDGKFRSFTARPILHAHPVQP
jgi:hypothetical protein